MEEVANEKGSYTVREQEYRTGRWQLTRFLISCSLHSFGRVTFRSRRVRTPQTIRDSLSRENARVPHSFHSTVKRPIREEPPCLSPPIDPATSPKDHPASRIHQSRPHFNFLLHPSWISFAGIVQRSCCRITAFAR